MQCLTLHIDGGSRGNPGPAGYGVVITDEAGATVRTLRRYLGPRTNNYAEYSALLAGLECARELGAARVRVVADSELLVRQMQGRYQVRSPLLRPLYEQAYARAGQFEQFEIKHVRREKNREADRLANLAMDEGMKEPGGAIR